MGPGPGSPLLIPVEFKPGSSPEPISTPPRHRVLPSDSQGQRAHKTHRSRPRPVQTQGDAVIINFLGNHNFPHIAQQAAEEPLSFGSEGESDSSPAEDMATSAGPTPSQLRHTAEHALSRHGSLDGRARSGSKSSAPLDMIMNQEGSQIPRPKLDTSDQTLTLAKTSIGAHMLPAPALSAGSTEPPSAIIRTPDTGQSLPSLRNHLGSFSDVKLPPFSRPSFQSPSSTLQSPSADLAALRYSSGAKSMNVPAPTSAHPSLTMSPPGTAHQVSPPARSFQDITMSPPSQHPPLRGVSSPRSESATPSSIYSASTYQQRSPGESISSPEHVMQIDSTGTMRQMLPLPTAPGMSPGMVFRCKMAGCTAPPFQTQYLLNSHMNVHSSARPHYCPRKGCPRGEGGKGFKRKNEMIRHGLVHQSPGYACPFCPDREHKYPRPDNLQRHVKVHHVDKDKDDAILRDVLNQRIDGGSRGRRKRANS